MAQLSVNQILRISENAPSYALDTIRNAIRTAENATERVGATGYTYQQAEDLLEAVSELSTPHMTPSGRMSITKADWKQMTPFEQKELISQAVTFNRYHKKIIKQMQREQGKAAHYKTAGKKQRKQTWEDVGKGSFLASSNLVSDFYEYYNNDLPMFDEDIKDIVPDADSDDLEQIKQSLFAGAQSGDQWHGLEESLSQAVEKAYNQLRQSREGEKRKARGKKK